MANENRFQKLVAEAKKNIVEMPPEEAADKLKSGEGVVIDVRERNDWDNEHVRDAVHLNRGEVKLEIEEKVPDLNTLIICHCGGGSRSALVAESLQKMGYK